MPNNNCFLVLLGLEKPERKPSLKRMLVIVFLGVLCPCPTLFGQGSQGGNGSHGYSSEVSEEAEEVPERWADMQGGAILPESGVFSMPRRREKLIGSFYLTQNYVSTNLLLKDGLRIADAPAKYNNLTNLFVFDADSGEYQAISGMRVQQFDFEGSAGRRTFVNINQYPRNPFEYIGFYEVLYEGTQVLLLAQLEMQVHEPTYNLILDIGERARKVTYKSKYYVYIQEEVRALKNFRSSGLESFGDRRVGMKKFIKESNLNFKKQGDVIRAVRQLDSMMQNGS